NHKYMALALIERPCFGVPEVRAALSKAYYRPSASDHKHQLLLRFGEQWAYLHSIQIQILERARLLCTSQPFVLVRFAKGKVFLDGLVESEFLAYVTPFL